MNVCRVTLIFLLWPAAVRPVWAGQTGAGQAGLGGRQQAAAEVKPAMIQGKVLASDTGTGLRKVTLTLWPAERQEGQLPLTTKTNENGEYEFKDVAPGRYNLGADRNGYVRQTYGQPASNPGPSPGTPLVVKAGEILSRIDLTLIRGGALEGRVVDQEGEPVSRVAVQLSRYRTVRSRRALTPVAFDQTDDRGEYRLFDIPPGNYYLSASLRGFGTQEGGSTYLPTYYPGALSPQEATRIQVAPAAQLAGYDLVLFEGRGYTVSGRVLAADGKPATRAFLMSMRLPFQGTGSGFGGSPIDAEGNFRMDGLPPGSYRLTARAESGNNRQAASTVVDVVNEDLSGVTLMLGPGAEIHGRVLFDQRVEDFNASQLRVGVTPEDPSPMMFGSSGSGDVKEDYTFSLSDIPEGPGRLWVRLPPGNVFLQAIHLQGRDVVDQAVDFRNNDQMRGVEIILSARGAQFSGTVRREQTGEIIKGASVLLFSPDPELRASNSRFTRITQTDQNGAFSLRGLVPAEYLSCALLNFETGAESDPTYLKTLETLAQRVTLAPSENKTESLNAVPAPPID
ncbi:MAG: carboxypeptidase regulatory-like domain-containing protein [Acidobacteriota bacterium]